MSKFNIGDRVRVIAKVDHYGYYRQVGTITKQLDHDIYRVEFSDRCETAYFDRKLELVTEGGDMETKQRRTFRLLKDMPGYKKGTLFQEQCEDGTQPYSPMDVPGFTNDTRLEFRNRSEVEQNPSWFVEVFKVTPEYMTREELDQWEVFKSHKPARTIKLQPKRKYVKRSKEVRKLPAQRQYQKLTKSSYTYGTQRISRERMAEVLEAIIEGRGETVRIARKLGIKPATVNAYKTLARANGLL